jgi:transcription elongation factor Elf1
MSREPYPYALQCPTCGARGTVEISETTTDKAAEAEITFCDVPAPFELVSAQPIKFRCLTCDELSI